MTSCLGTTDTMQTCLAPLNNLYDASVHRKTADAYAMDELSDDYRGNRWQHKGVGNGDITH